MALLEKDNDIHATYYILLNGGLYNALAPENVEKIRVIRKAGHEIGLHVDSRYYLGPIEFSMLEHIAECDVTTWCHHLITVTPHLVIPRNAAEIPYKYLSDSAHNWREGCLCQHVNEYDKLQVLIHPEWHLCSPSATLSKWEILNQLEWEANRRNAISFQKFRDLMAAHDSAINLYSESESKRDTYIEVTKKLDDGDNSVQVWL